MKTKRKWPGSGWAAICDRCGFRFYSTELRKEWTGAMVCEKDFETRHPQDLIRPKPERPPIPWSRPEKEDTFVDITYAET